MMLVDDTLDELTIKPEGVHNLAQFDPADPVPYILFKNDVYTLLMRVHGFFDQADEDAFEVLLLQNEQIVFHEDVFREQMNKASIRDVIRQFNSRN